MERGTMERRLYDASIKGDVTALDELLQEDPLLLDRVTVTCFNETPLHIAVMRGHVDFVEEILTQNPQLAMELDSRKSSPLHMASFKGNLEIVKALLDVNPDMCLACDRDGRNPIHLAAMKGRIEVLEVLLQQTPSLAALRKLHRGQTILHLCVEYNQLEALKMLVEALNDPQFVNAKDDDGNTILHLAVIDIQIETIKYLVTNTNIVLNEMNGKGQTPLDILAQTQRNMIGLDILESLEEAGALRARDILSSSSENNTIMVDYLSINVHNQTASSFTKRSKRHHHHEKIEWLTKKRDVIMVVASLIATMAFQAVVNPTGGVWQDNLSVDSQGNPISNPYHRAGEAVMAYNYPILYGYFLRANAVAFITSVSTIMLLVSGLPFRRRIFLWILMVTMWVTISALVLTYGISIVVITPVKDRGKLSHVVNLSVTVWCSVLALLLVGNTKRFMARWLNKRAVNIWPPSNFRNSTDVNYDDRTQGTLQIQVL